MLNKRDNFYMSRLLLIWCFFSAYGIPSLWGQSKIDWLTWEEVQEKSKTEKRKIFVDIYTDWCGWCKKMDQTTFSNEKVIQYINKNYYAVRFNAEYKQDIILKGKVYQYTRYGNRGYHQLATTLLQNKLSFPSLAFLDEDLNLIQAIPGYQDDWFFLMISTYFAENAHKKIPWNRFVEEFEAKSKSAVTKNAKIRN